MADAENSEEQAPNLPLVAVRGVVDSDVWRCFERYNIPFNPPTDTERKLTEVILALEDLVTDQETTITRLRNRPSA
ncbi:hypothetical protein JAO73_10440 [Hymenobacter sp. BT523]|uniref:hypothetical protein n=1 Tax=Hymenobacter sp. BT523 TaxID=2795725 RepID=UPI0018EA6997|nr:hypothetical protein [Hymenobacter sp. BT523]MBJ6109433.1 hypothetical protein [Hymenobacter sp. BT523]